MFAKLFRSNGPRQDRLCGAGGSDCRPPPRCKCLAGPGLECLPALDRWPRSAMARHACPRLRWGQCRAVRLVDEFADVPASPRSKDITFTCARGTGAPSWFRSALSARLRRAARTLSRPLACACAEKGGVKDLMSVGIDIVRQGASAETLANGCTYTGNFVSGQRHREGTLRLPEQVHLRGQLHDGPDQWPWQRDASHRRAL